MSQGAAFIRLARRVREHLGQEERYSHSVRVARCGGNLARRHGVNAGKSRLAGLLHDLARLYSAPQLIAECEVRNLHIEPFERSHPVLLHARLGAAIARERFGIDDPEVLSAIEKHTTAAAEMSPLDCVVYLADSLEPQRRFADRSTLCDLAKRDLHEAMRQVLTLNLRHHARKGVAAAPPTLAAAKFFGVDPPEMLAPEVSASR